MITYLKFCFLCLGILAVLSLPDVREVRKKEKRKEKAMTTIWTKTDNPLQDRYEIEDIVGFIPLFLDVDDPRPAREQFDANYQHGGGWRPSESWTFDPDTLTAQYPEDPPLQALVVCQFRDETIYVFQSGLVMIVQPDGSFEMARMD